MIPEEDGYEVVPWEERHRAGVLRLRTLFRGIAPAWNAAHFRWQHEENPCFEGHWVQLALCRGEVVAMRVLQHALWELGDAAVRLRAPCFAGTAIDPAHRQKGLFGLLTRASEAELGRRGVEWAFNLSAGAATHVSSLAEGWRGTGPLRPLGRPQSIGGRRVRDRVLRYAVRAARYASRPEPGVRIEAEPRPEDMAGLAAEARRPDRIRRVRDAAYFRWRFRDPSSRYRFLYVERGGRVAGFLALHRPAPPIASGALTIADWECSAGLSFDELLGAAVAYAERIQKPLGTWSAAWPEPAQHALRRLGFEDAPEPGPLASSRPTILVRRIGADGGDAPWQVAGVALDTLEGWDARLTDSDAF
ncbi:MAG TPA: hypothetical protein VHQ66_01295 [Myxococcota bacterium]|nr:hypothetical protein [Myxococcota bacterium]